MISVTDLRSGTTFEDGGQLFKVLSYEHIKMGRGTANVKVKVKNLRRGTVMDKSFISNAKVQEVALNKKKYQFLYKDSENAYFMDEATYEQIPIAFRLLGDESSYLKEGMTLPILFTQDEPLSLELPPKMEFVVKETGPDIRGNSATNIYKDAILENSLTVRVPLFTKVGDRVIVDTRTGEYSERAK